MTVPKNFPKEFQSPFPVRGTTHSRCMVAGLINRFNPRSREGNDQGVPDRLSSSQRFNPRSPRGERRSLDTIENKR